MQYFYILSHYVTFCSAFITPSPALITPFPVNAFPNILVANILITLEEIRLFVLLFHF